MKNNEKVTSKQITNGELKLILKSYGSPITDFCEYIKRSRSYFHTANYSPTQTMPVKIVDKLIEFVGVENYNYIYDKVILERRNEIAERTKKRELKHE